MTEGCERAGHAKRYLQIVSLQEQRLLKVVALPLDRARQQASVVASVTQVCRTIEHNRMKVGNKQE